jgi:translocator protein
MMELKPLLALIALLVFSAPIGPAAAFTCPTHCSTFPSRQAQVVARTGTTTKSSTSLDLTVSPVAWAVGHAVGGALGAPVVAKAKVWYKRINLPPWTPPDFLFAPVWTMLYSAMGVAAARVYQNTQSLSSLPMVLWMIHYVVLNLSWAPVFFGMKRLRLGMILNTLMLATLLVIIPLFYQINKLSGLLLLPYLAWLSFATVLNSAICRRNPTKNGYNEAMLQADLVKLQKAAAAYAGV